MFYDNDNYELSTSTEAENLLAELPFDLLKASIIDQINDPVSTNVNYVEVIVEKCKLSKENLSNNEDALRIIDAALREFFVFVIEEINKRFDLGVDIEAISDSDEMIEIGESMYNYFILRYVKNISKFITNYILEHKKELTEYYSDKNKKDISTLTYRKQLKDSQDLCIIINLPSIINYIISLDIDPLEFVSLSAGKNNYVASVVKGLILSNKMIGNFVDDYIGLSTDSHDYLIDQIQTDIKVKIIKKLT